VLVTVAGAVLVVVVVVVVFLLEVLVEALLETVGVDVSTGSLDTSEETFGSLETISSLGTTSALETTSSLEVSATSTEFILLVDGANINIALHVIIAIKPTLPTITATFFVLLRLLYLFLIFKTVSSFILNIDF